MEQSPQYVIEMLHITKEFPGIKANDDITLQLRKGEIHALLGENGAGKSTTLKAVAGLVRPKSGEILLDGTNLVGKSTDQIVSSGVTLVNVRPSCSALAMRKCVSASAAICGRCVIQMIWCVRPKRFIFSETICAVRPLIPLSISSKISVSTFSWSAITDLTASMILESSPPDAVSCTGRSG